MNIDYNSIAKLAFDWQATAITFNVSDNNKIRIVVYDKYNSAWVFENIDECESFLLDKRTLSQEIVNNVFIIKHHVWNNTYNHHLISYTTNKMVRNSITKDAIEWKNCVIDESFGQFECLDIDNQIACFHLEQKQNRYTKLSELSL